MLIVVYIFFILIIIKIMLLSVLIVGTERSK